MTVPDRGLLDSALMQRSANGIKAAASKFLRIDRCPPKLEEAARRPPKCPSAVRIDWPGPTSFLKIALARHDRATMLLSPVAEWNAKLLQSDEAASQSAQHQTSSSA
jgi:hypothetical protein